MDKPDAKFHSAANTTGDRKPVGDMNGRDHSGRWDALLRLHLGMIGRCAGVVVVVEDEFAVAVAAVATVIALADELDRLLVVGGGGFDGV